MFLKTTKNESRFSNLYRNVIIREIITTVSSLNIRYFLFQRYKVYSKTLSVMGRFQLKKTKVNYQMKKEMQFVRSIVQCFLFIFILVFTLESLDFVLKSYLLLKDYKQNKNENFPFSSRIDISTLSISLFDRKRI